MTTVYTDVFFDVLHAGEDKIKKSREVYRAVFRRRTDLPVNFNFSMTRIMCPSCATSFDATKVNICPSCGHEYDIIEDDWTLADLKIK